MKRLLLFLLLLSVALLVLRWFEGPGPATSSPPSAESESGAAGAGVATRPDYQGLALSGPFRTRFFSEVPPHRATVEIESEDSRTLDAYDEFLAVHVRGFDPATGDEQASLNAVSARLRRSFVGEDLFPRFEKKVELFALEGTLLSGAPLVPMTLATPSAELDVTDGADRKLSSAARVDITSPGLEASGTGLNVRFDAATLRLRSDGSIDFAREASAPVLLRCAGPLDIRRRPEERGRAPRIEVEARDEVVMVFPEAAGSTLNAAHVLILGTEAEGAEGEFLLERLDADGEVVWEAGETTAHGERATLFFDVRGALETWSLEGQPSLRVSLALLEGVELPGGVAPDEGRFVRIEGRGPLTGRTGGVRSFDMAGPATLESGDVVLQAARRVRGRVTEDETAAHFTATGGVVLQTGRGTAEDLDDHTLETTELDVDVHRDERGEVVQDITTLGGAKLVGKLRDGVPFTLTSSDRIEARYVLPSAPEAPGEPKPRPRWHVDQARGVVLTVEGPRGFTARADDVEDFDPRAMTLQATGNVSLQGTRGRGAGERMVVTGPGSFLLEGTAEERAWFQRPDGRADARTVELRFTEGEHEKTSRFTARGDVRADFHREDDPERGYEGYDIRCDDLILDGRETFDPATGLMERTLTVHAKVGVDATVGWSGERTRVQCDTLDGERTETWKGEGEEAPLLGAVSALEADGHVIAHLTYAQSDLDLDCRHLSLDLTEGAPRGETYFVSSTGKVRFDLLMHRQEEGADEAAEKITLSGEGERLTFDETFSGSLEPLPHERVLVIGHALSQNAPFELTANRFDFTGADQFSAASPELTIWRFGPAREGLPLEATGVRATGQRLEATREALEFLGDVTLLSRTREGAPWTLSADHIVLRGQLETAGSAAQLDAVEAEGHVRFDLGVLGKRLDEQIIASARGARLMADSIWGTLRLEGDPKGEAARIASPAFVSSASWIDFDPAERIIVATGPGRMTAGGVANDGLPAEWELEYAAFTTRMTPDEIIYLLREPQFSYPLSRSGLRASWGVFWVDRRQWKNLPETVEKEAGGVSELQVRSPEPLPLYPAGSPMAKLLEFLRDRRVEGLVREIYLEGPVEMREEEDTVAEASAVYFDAVAGHGWVVDAKFKITGESVGQSFDQLHVEARWLRHSEDGSLRAKDAEISSSPLAVPGVCIVTGDLLVTPVVDQKAKYEVLLRDNRLQFYDRVRLPLPPIRYLSGEDYKPLWQSLRIADSARFGTFVSAGISRPAGKVGEVINQALGGDPKTYEAHWRADASYLGSRGALIDLGLAVKSKRDYGIDLRLGVVPDTGTDRGYIRIDEEDRSPLRLWSRADSRLDIDERQWIDIALSKQSDPGVQSEFWEREFERYERDESYVQWRRARAERYFDLTVKGRTETFRSEVDELPSLGLYRGRAPRFRLGPLSLLHMGNTRASYVYRRAGEFGVQSPFSSAPSLDATGVFADGLGDRGLARFDTEQRLEAPFRLGVAGVRATPFVSTRLTAWSEGRNPDGHPRRFLTEAGLRLGTTFWKASRANPGGTHFLSPFFEMTRELGFEKTGRPVPFDATENPVGGNRLSFGLRARLDVDEGGPWLDLELRDTYATDMRDGTPDGWLPLEVFGVMRIEPFGVPARIRHEGRYDIDDGYTDYALTSVASRITKNLGIEAGHRLARDARARLIVDAASISTIYRWTPKWEFEARETIPLMTENAMDTSFLLRRYGADIIFEIVSSVREGEGASVGISIRPRFGWRARRIGYLDG